MAINKRAFPVKETNKRAVKNNIEDIQIYEKNNTI